MKKGYVLIVVILVCFTNCNKRPQSGEVFVKTNDIVTSDSLMQLSPPMREGALSFDSIIEVVQYLPLSTKDTVLISRIDDIKMLEEVYYIADYKKGRIFAFDCNGNCVGKIDDFGEGPKQYKRICSFDIDKKNKLLYLLDGDLGKVYVYNSSLQLCNLIKLPYSFVDHLAFYNESELFLELGFREYGKRDKTSPNLVLYNFKEKCTVSTFLYFEKGKIHYRNQNPIAFSSGSEGLYYWTTLGSSIYSCHNRFLEECIHFDLGSYTTPASIYFEKISVASSLMKEKKYAYIDRFYELKNWYYARISRINSSAHYFYNKEKQKGFLDISFIQTNDKLKIIMPNLFQISDTMCCSYIYPEQYVTLLDDETLETINIEDNPILILYKLKE